MRAKKILKVTSIVMASLALLLLFLVAFFLFNPFEGSLPEIRDVVPRSVDFYVHKARLTEDFDIDEGVGGTDRFPYFPYLEQIGKDPAWASIKKGSWYRGTGIARHLRELRKGFQDIRRDVPVLHPVDDLIGEEIQVAGRFGQRGYEDSAWCVYTRVSMWGKAAYGMLARGFVRDQLRANVGCVVTDEQGFYKLRMQGQDFYLVRYLDCVMFSNDKPLLVDSYDLAQGNTENVEPLGSSAHYLEGVSRPQERWVTTTDVVAPNSLEYHLRPGQLIEKLPDWRNWPDTRNEDKLNERILASFVNLASWRFLSGSVIFEENSLTLLSHLVVNTNNYTPFQKALFTVETTSRSKWMDRFFQMVPTDACGAAALKMPAGDFVLEMFKAGLDKDTRHEIDGAIRRTGKYKSLADLVSKIQVRLRPRVGVIFRPNRRSPKTKADFKVNFASPFPQWAWVFWVKKHHTSGRTMNKPLKDLIQFVNSHRSAFLIANGYKLSLGAGGGSVDAAFEFAIPSVPGTGSIAICTYGEYFVFGNSGPFIHRIVHSLYDPENYGSRRQDKDFEAFVEEMPAAVNGVVFVWADKLKEVLADFDEFAGTDSASPDPAWAMSNRPKAERLAFRMSKWARFGVISRIPTDQKEAFNEDVGSELGKLWAKDRRKMIGADPASLAQWRSLLGTFRSAYLQMVMDSTSLQVWGRVLTPGYRH